MTRPAPVGTDPRLALLGDAARVSQGTDDVIEAAAWAADEIERLRHDAMVLACAFAGISPDHNTQSVEEVAATEALQNETADRIIAAAPGWWPCGIRGRLPQEGDHG